MVTMKNDGRVAVTIILDGEGESLLLMQQAILLGIECLGSHPEHSGDKDYRKAVFFLSDLMKQFLVNKSQINVGLGGKPYQDELKVTQSSAKQA